MNKIYMFAYRDWAWRLLHENTQFSPELQMSRLITPAKNLEEAKDYFTMEDRREGDSYCDTEIQGVDPKNLLSIRSQFDKTDLLLFYGWSWMVPKEFTDELTCICLHPSPLPKYRGGSPIQNQVIAGETTSQVTLFKMGQGLDDGPIYNQVPFSLLGDLEWIYNSLRRAAYHATSALVKDWLKNPNLVFTEQDHSQATYFKRRKPEDSQILLSETAKQIYNKVRCLGYDGYPMAYLVNEHGEKIYIQEVTLKT